MTASSGRDTRHEAGIGLRLRSARERCGLTIEQAAQKLHLESAILEALEAEDFGSLGAPIYVKGYLGRYAELVGESVESLQQLLSGTVIPPPDLTRIPRARVAGGRPIGPVAIVIAVVVLVVVGSLWWGVSHWRARHPVFLQSRAVHSRVVPRTLTQRAPAAAGARPVLAASPQHVRGTAGADGAGRGGRSPAAHSAAQVRITLRFSAQSWVEVDDASGRQLYHAMARAGAVRVFKGQAPLHVVLGYAPAVRLSVDGRDKPIGALAQGDHAASLQITADGRVLSGPRPGGE